MKYGIHKYDNGYKVKCNNISSEMINRKIMLTKDEKIFMGKNEFALWKPTMADVDNILHSIKFFSSLENNKDSKISKEISDDAIEKKLHLIMKLSEIKGIVSIVQGETPEQSLSHVIKRYKSNACRRSKNLSDALQKLQKWSHQ